MLLILALVLLIAFALGGFFLHLLWIGLILAVIVGIAHVLTGRHS